MINKIGESKLDNSHRHSVRLREEALSNARVQP